MVVYGGSGLCCGEAVVAVCVGRSCERLQLSGGLTRLSRSVSKVVVWFMGAKSTSVEPRTWRGSERKGVMLRLLRLILLRRGVQVYI